MGAVLSFFRPAPVARGDWSQQEIAEFYRVEAALTQAGLHVTTDRGVSDEGDPWFIFCRFDGDVILHFARIDDLYVIASEAFGRPLQGPDFRALLNAVAAEHPTLMPLPRPDARGARGNLVLHPAALLAAIVATAAFQLAGGDAMAGELAGDAAAAPMLQPGADMPGADMPGADLPGGDHAGPEGAFYDPHGPAGATGGAQAGEDENRSARHAVILSALALISASLPSEQTASPGLPALGDGIATGSQGKGAPKHTPDADLTRESVLAPKRAEASADTPIGEAAGEQANLARTSFVTISPAQTPTNVEGLSLTSLNILGLGAAGGQEIAAVRATESAPPIASILAMRAAGHAPSVAAAVEKSAAPAVAEGASAPSAGASSSAVPAASVVSLPNAGAPTAVSSVPGAEPTAGGSLPSTAGTGPLSSPGAASAPGATVKAAGASGMLDTTHAAAVVSAAVSATGTATTGAASTGATSGAVQTVSVMAVTYTADVVAHAALSSFIDQSAAGSGGAVPTAAGATGVGDVADPWLTAWAKSIGSRAPTDVLGSLLKYASGPSVDATGSSAPLTDQAAGTAMAATQIGGTSGATAGPEIKVGLAAAAASTTGALLAGTLAAPGAKDPAGATETLATTATSVTAPADKLAAADGHTDAATTAGTAPTLVPATDKLAAAGAIAGADGHTTAVAAAAPTAAAPTAAATDKLAGPVAPVATESHANTAATLSTATDKLAAAVATATADGHVDAAAAAALTAATDKLAGAVAPVAAEGHATTAAALSPATDTLVGAGDTTAVLDTTTLKLPTFVASAPALDDRGRELIARFLDTTAQVRTIVTEHSVVMIDMDASHYTNPDFALRTWNIGHDVEISIVGLAGDVHLTHAAGIAG